MATAATVAAAAAGRPSATAAAAAAADDASATDGAGVPSAHLSGSEPDFSPAEERRLSRTKQRQKQNMATYGYSNTKSTKSPGAAVRRWGAGVSDAASTSVAASPVVDRAVDILDSLMDADAGSDATDNQGAGLIPEPEPDLSPVEEPEPEPEAKPAASAAVDSPAIDQQAVDILDTIMDVEAGSDANDQDAALMPASEPEPVPVPAQRGTRKRSNLSSAGVARDEETAPAIAANPAANAAAANTARRAKRAKNTLAVSTNTAARAKDPDGLRKGKSPAKSPARSPHAGNVNKKNDKGETPLQRACIRGDLGETTRLLGLNANVNAKDNARWTPLHEACSRGFTDVAAFLIASSADVNAQGSANTTPLHDAVTLGQTDMIELLLENGADIGAVDADGKNPADVTDDDALRGLLLAKGRALPAATKIRRKASTSTASGDGSQSSSGALRRKIVVTLTGLRSAEKEGVQKKLSKLGVQVSSDFSKHATHLVTSTDGQNCCKRTLKFYKAVASGRWIVGTGWIDASAQHKCLCPEDRFECDGDVASKGGPGRSRRNAARQDPGLFDGCHFHLKGRFDNPAMISKKDMTDIIALAGGQVVAREPTNETASTASPFHWPACKVRRNAVAAVQCGSRGLAHRFAIDRAPLAHTCPPTTTPSFLPRRIPPVRLPCSGRWHRALSCHRALSDTNAGGYPV